MSVSDTPRGTETTRFDKTTHRTHPAQVPEVAVNRAAAAWTARIVGAVLALAVSVIHVMDQGGVPGSKDPRYVGVGYWLLEIAGIVVAAGLLAPATRHLRAVWLLAIGVAAGPLVGYALSRGPGLPNYTDDRGNWTEPLGMISILVELALLLVAVRAARKPVLQAVVEPY